MDKTPWRVLVGDDRYLLRRHISIHIARMCPNLGTAGTGPKRVQAGRAMEIEGDHQLQSITASSHARQGSWQTGRPGGTG